MLINQSHGRLSSFVGVPNPPDIKEVILEMYVRNVLLFDSQWSPPAAYQLEVP